MILYVVLHVFEDEEIVGIYMSKANANEAICKILKDNPDVVNHSKSEYKIKQFKLGETIDPWKKYKN